MMEKLIIRSLNAFDATILSSFFLAQRKEYLAYFTPFSFDEETLFNVLSEKKEDDFFGIFWNNVIIAFFMLRGWDEGYAIPAYGVVIDQNFNSKGLATLTLDFSRTYCVLRGCCRIMLSVHPQNIRAQRIYEKFGFVQTGFNLRNSNLIYHLEI